MKHVICAGAALCIAAVPLAAAAQDMGKPTDQLEKNQAAPKKQKPKPQIDKDGDVSAPWEMRPEEIKDWDEYLEKYSLSCIGPIGKTVKNPMTQEIAGKTWVFEGFRARVAKGGDPKREIRIGVVSGTKDFVEETQHNLKWFVDEWKKEKVEMIVIGGDVAYEEEDLKNIVKLLAEPGWPAFVVIGNNDSRGDFNRVIRKLVKKMPNIINMDLIRVVLGDGLDFVSLPGYYDRKFTRGSSSCTYKDDNVKELIPLSEETKYPIFLITHAPPKMDGKNAIDYAFEAGNVGDPLMAEMIGETKVKFAVMGHIIEAGGKATDVKGRVIKQGDWAPQLFVNPGAAQSLPWKLHDGTTSNGMGAIMYVKAGKAKYRILIPPKWEKKEE
ncbi:MAG: metallophosphoesterase [Deltaproteobacteria bacterium]|nr:metallophosphoesterase [Deltaproteobacteria bacterium]